MPLQRAVNAVQIRFECVSNYFHGVISHRQHRKDQEREQGDECDGAEDFFCGVCHGKCG